MNLIRTIRRTFKTLTPEDYLINQRDSMLAGKCHKKTLNVLENANQGDLDIADQIQLIGVPKGKLKQSTYKYDTYHLLLEQHEVDLIFLQIDPSSYMARQRFMSHRCAMRQVEDYRKDGIQLIDPIKPITFQQTVINLLTLDLIRANKIPSENKITKGLYTYNYPMVQEKQQAKEIHELFMKQISYDILEGQRTGYNLIDKVLYAGLMGRQKIMLGGMPETLYRMILGKGLSVQEMRDIFRLVIQKNQQLTIPFSIKDATQNFLPHIFLLPKDLYMTAILKESFQAAISMLSFVHMQHWRPMQQYWIGPPTGINMTQATRIPQGFPGETQQDLIQKQAILDVLMNTRTWSKKYLANPFPYLFEDITKVDPQQLTHNKKLFLKYYHKYSQFAKRKQKQLPNYEDSLKLDNTKLQQQELNKMKQTEDYKKSLGLSYLNSFNYKVQQKGNIL